MRHWPLKRQLKSEARLSKMHFSLGRKSWRPDKYPNQHESRLMAYFFPSTSALASKQAGIEYEVSFFVLC